MSDLKDFQGTVFNSAKTVVSKSHSGSDNADVTGNVGLELTSLEHTITADVQSVVIIGTFEGSISGADASHILQCWRNEVPTYSGLSYDHSTLVGNSVLRTGHPSANTKNTSFIIVDNNIGDSTQQRYRWTLKTSTGNTQSRTITLKYLTNPMWDLRNL